MAYANSIILGSLSLLIDKITPKKVQGTVKQVIGKSLRLINIPDRKVQDWQLQVAGKFIDSSRETDRTTLEGFDDLVVHTFTDGIHNGSYFIIPGSLIFSDDKGISTHIKYSFTLIQDQ